LRENAVSREPVMFMDIMPTIAAAVGAPLPQGRGLEGRNMLPVLTGKASGPLHDALFWDGGQEKTAIRSGDWKLVNNPGKIELFNLRQDAGEKTGLAAQKPEIVAQLRQKFDAWSKLNAPRIGAGGANDEDEGGARRARKQGKKGKQ
jgi:uncharacterized sulfatase